MGIWSGLMSPVRTFWRDLSLNLVVLLLLVISFVATWRGLSDFVSVQDGVEGSLALRFLIFAIVLALTLAMYVSLRELLRRRNWIRIVPAVLAALLYGVLALWSIGFGYGFWWSVLAGQATSERELSAALDTLEGDITKVSARIESAQLVMASAASLSAEKAAQESREGGSCGVSSGRGEGPLFRARMETNQTVTALAQTIEDDWAKPLQTQLADLREVTLSGIVGDDRAQLELRFRRASQSASELSASAQARGESFAALLEAKADQLDDPPDDGQVAYCYDPDLAQALKGAADALRFGNDVQPASWTYSGGQEGVARSIESLWGHVFRMEWPQFDGRSLVALIIAAATDLTLFVFAFFQSSGNAARQRSAITGRRDDIALATRKLETEMEVLTQERARMAEDLSNARSELSKAQEKLALNVGSEDVQWLEANVNDLTATLNRLRREAIGGSANRELEDLQEKLDSVIQGLRALT